MNEKRSRTDERRADVLKAAIAEFAAKGLHGASTEAIAVAAGISHPYLFKLFGSKRELFLAALDRVHHRIHDAFAAAAETDPDEPLRAMGDAYFNLLEGRDELRVLLHGFAAAGDPGVGPFVRERYAELFRSAQRISGADEAKMQSFWAHGMLLTIAAAIDLQAISAEEAWIDGLLTHKP